MKINNSWRGTLSSLFIISTSGVEIVYSSPGCYLHVRSYWSRGTRRRALGLGNLHWPVNWKNGIIRCSSTRGAEQCSWWRHWTEFCFVVCPFSCKWDYRKCFSAHCSAKSTRSPATYFSGENSGWTVHCTQEWPALNYPILWSLNASEWEWRDNQWSNSMTRHKHAELLRTLYKVFYALLESRIPMWNHYRE